MTTLQIDLPDDLAQEVQQAGLLAPDALEAMMRSALRNRKTARLSSLLDRVEQDDEPPMTMAEVNAEIAAHRAERRRARSS